MMGRMEATAILQSDADRSVWLRERRSGIGSSDAPVILGLVKRASPLSLYADKIGMVDDDDDAGEIARWGRVLEPVVMAEFAHVQGDAPYRMDGWLYRSNADPTRLCTLDAWLRDDVCEVKTAPESTPEWEEGGVPAAVFCQVQHQLLVTGLDHSIVVALLRGYRLRWSRVERDQKFIDEVLQPAEADFWHRVSTGRPPAPDASEATRRALALLYPDDSGETVTLPGEFIDLDLRRCAIDEAVKALAQERDLIDNRIRAEMGAATTGTLSSGVSYTNKTVRKKSYVAKATQYRTLRRHEPKGERSAT